MNNQPKPATGMETELPTEIHVKIDPSLLPKPATDAEISERAARERFHGRSITILAQGEPKPAAGYDEWLKTTVQPSPMPKPDEWTAQTAINIAGDNFSGAWDVAHAHNAAIAAEREKVQTLVDAIEYVMESSLTRGPEAICECFDKLESALAKVKENQ